MPFMEQFPFGIWSNILRTSGFIFHLFSFTALYCSSSSRSRASSKLALKTKTRYYPSSIATLRDMVYGIPPRVPTYKIHRLILPVVVLVAGITIFLCGLIKSYHLIKSVAEAEHERQYLQAQNDHLEWWVGFLLMGTAALAIISVLLDKAWLFKLSVLMTGFCSVVLIFALFWDAGEFSEVAGHKHMVQFLTADGHTCATGKHNFTFAGAEYTFHDCECIKDDKQNIGSFIPYSCELLDGLYYVNAMLAFAMACAVAFSMFTIFSFVLILKRISQITTALHLDEKPLSDDFSNLSGDLYIESG